MIRVAASESGLKIVNPLHSFDVPWSEIESFELGYPEAWVWTWFPVLVDRAGRRIPMPAIQSPNPMTRPKNNYGAKAADALRSTLVRARAANGMASPDALARLAAEMNGTD